MKGVLKVIVSLAVLQCIGCSGLHKQDNYFSQFVNSKGKWEFYKREPTGEIVIVYNEQSNNEIPEINVEVNRIAGVVYSKYKKPIPLYCHYKYTFNKKRALVRRERLVSTCKFQLD